MEKKAPVQKNETFVESDNKTLSDNAANEEKFPCSECGRIFRR